MKLSMMVVTTSWAPRVALRKPGMKPQNAPNSSPAASDSGMAMMPGCSRQLDADDDGAEGAHQELSLRPDVEQAGLERQADRQAAEQQRHGRRRAC